MSEKELAGWNEARRPIDELNKNIGEAKKKKPQTDELKQQIAAWQKEVKALEQKLPKLPAAHTIHDGGNGDMHVALRGNLLKRGELAPRRFRAHCGRRGARTRTERPQAIGRGSGGSGQPAYCARVCESRWQHHFGHGLVRRITSAHWVKRPRIRLFLIGSSFVENDWSVKALRSLILTCRTSLRRSIAMATTGCFGG